MVKHTPSLLAGFTIINGLMMTAPIFAAETINTASLAASVAAPACIRYQPVGACFFLVCSMFECHIETSVKVGHFNPDLVVSAYNSIASSGDPIAGNPWTEAKSLYGSVNTAAASSLSSALGGLSGLLPSGGNYSAGKHQNVIFKEADVIGHPLASISSQFSSGLTCPSDATSFKPYFLSGFDVLAWRWQVPELLYPQAWIPGMREIGHFPLNTWGNIYPRTGTSTQADEAKLAAVIAQRSADIVTRQQQAHVYLSLGEGQDGSSLHVSDSLMVWSPGALKENDATNGHWQLVAPRLEKSCQVFGENDLTMPSGWGGGRIAASGNYAFTLWRPYSCCEIKGVFLGAIDVTSIIPSGNSMGSGSGIGGLGIGFSQGNNAGGNPILELPSVPSLPNLPLP